MLHRIVTFSHSLHLCPSLAFLLYLVYLPVTCYLFLLLRYATLIELQPREGGGGEGAPSPQHVAENTLNDIMDKFGEIKYDT